MSYEAFFKALKKALGRPDLYETWPDFEPVCDEEEYSWAGLYGISLALILNCGSCDGPCDPRHPRCRECVDRRSGRAAEAYKAYTGKERGWEAKILCRIYGNE